MSVDVATWRNRIVRSGDAALAEITANVANWRTHPKHQADALAGVLGSVGYVQQVVINARSGRLVDGHLRVELAARHGETSVPAVWVDLSDDEERLILATLDPLGALAGSDDAALRSLLASVSTSDDALAAMLADLGASAGIASAGNPADDPGAQVDRAEELRRKWGTERGQLWEAGRHRLLCGDATSAEDVARLMDGADGTVAGGHGTQKPLECMARPIRNHEGDVYDPFMGSGTTMVAAEQIGRICYGLEIEPKYVAVALERLSGMALTPRLV